MDHELQGLAGQRKSKIKLGYNHFNLNFLHLELQHDSIVISTNEAITGAIVNHTLCT